MSDGGRYGKLRTIAGIFKVLAWITIIFGGLGILAATVNAADQAGSGAALGLLVMGGLFVALYALMFFAAGEFIHLMIDVEGNTRRTAEALTGHGAPPPPAAGAV